MHRLKILILGGSVFLGRHLTEAFLSRGHEVTQFNRGLQNPHLFPEIEKLRGDRDRDLSLLRGRSWDAVVDTCGFFPGQVAAAADILHPGTPRYVFISSVNQYADLSVARVGEDYPCAAITIPAGQHNLRLTPETYGPLKAACEKTIRRIYGDSALVVRPGCLVGPHDQSHRFSYWARRVAAGGQMLVPGSPDQLWQIIDARDVAEWIVRMLEEGGSGTFNVVGPEQPVSAGQLFQKLASAAGIGVQPIWMDTEFLRGKPGGARWLDLAEWSDLPATMAHLYSIDNARAIAAGLRFRPLAATAKDVLCWLALRTPREADALLPERESSLLSDWKCSAPHQAKNFDSTPSIGHMLKPIAQDTVHDALSHTFYVTSWGYGADHWFSWFVKALNANPEIMAYLANEGSRPKYFPEERSRAHRPDLVKFTRFMADVGMTYTAIGDCYSYRPTMMHAVLEAWPDVVRILQLTRHPYAWLFFHVRWRATNMRMLGGEQGPLEHEWLHGCDHDLFKRLGLRPYEKADIEVWTTFQGMWKMNDVASDSKMPIRQIPIEQVVANRELFCEIIDYITHGRVKYDERLLDLIYGWVWTPFRGEAKLRVSPRELRAEWPDWKIEAFEKLVSQEAQESFLKLGYEL